MRTAFRATLLALALLLCLAACATARPRDAAYLSVTNRGWPRVTVRACRATLCAPVAHVEGLTTSRLTRLPRYALGDGIHIVLDVLAGGRVRLDGVLVLRAGDVVCVDVAVDVSQSMAWVCTR